MLLLYLFLPELIIIQVLRVYLFLYELMITQLLRVLFIQYGDISPVVKIYLIKALELSFFKDYK